MKRPLSPPLPPESGDADASSVNEDVTELQSVTADGTQKRERKLQTFTLCGVCNIQLNSAAQAQIHYNGKSHQKRLKKLQNGKMPTSQVVVFDAVVDLTAGSPNPPALQNHLYILCHHSKGLPNHHHPRRNYRLSLNSDLVGNNPIL
ncbi:uncharacterized protein LOC134340256 isoform X2 [Mobula hypostoma]